MVSKRSRRSPRRVVEQRGTNWKVIGGMAAVGVIALFTLLFLAALPSSPEAASSLIEYCEENPANCVARGEPDAPVSIVEVSDYGCPHCADFNRETAPILDEAYVETGRVRWVVLPYALRPETTPAAEASLCAAEQDAFFPYHETLFAFRGAPQALTQEGLLLVAEGLGLDSGQFEDCLSSGRYQRIIQQNQVAARRVGISGTPTFFIGEEMLEGNYPYDAFRQRIEQALGS